MSNGVNNTVGDVSLKMGVDSSTVSAEAKAAAEKANAAAEETLLKQINARDVALRERQAKVIGGLKEEANAAAAAAEARKQAILNEAIAAADAMNTTGASAARAATATDKVSASLNAAKVALNGVRAAFGAVTFVLGTLAAAYAVVTSRSEENRRKVEEATRDYAKYIDSVQKLNQEFGNQTTDNVAKQIENVNAKYAEQADLIYRSTMTDKARQEAFQKNAADRAAAEQRVYDEANARGRAAQSRLAQDRRINELEERKANQESRDRRLAEDAAKAKSMEDDFDKLIDMMKEYEEQAARSAKKINDEFASAFRSIREESNRAFNTDNARSMVELAGNLNQTATTATANMNRIIVGGTD